MPEWLQKIIDRIVAWWKKFSTRQKIVLISIVAAVIIALIILIIAISQPKYVNLIHADSAVESASIAQILDDNGINYVRSQDGMSYQVEEKDYGNANILLGSNSIATDGYSIDDAINGSFTTTEADKAKKYKLYLESRFEEILETQNNVAEASVTLNIPDDDGTLIAKERDTFVAVKLTLTDSMDDTQAATLARFIATQVGNDSTDSISIIDQDSNPLFVGGESNTTASFATSQLKLKQKLEELKKMRVAEVMKGTEQYDSVSIAVNADIDYNNSSIKELEYWVAEGNTQGYLDYESNYESSATGGVAAVPGTDSNDDTTYMLDNGGVTESSVTSNTRDYLPNQTLRVTEVGAGAIKQETSSISVVGIRYHIYKEEELQKSGQLADMSFEEFIAANSERIPLEVDPGLVSLISNATGFDPSRITLLAYEVPMFEYKQSAGINLTDILQILLVILIFALLLFVVWRSTKSEKVEQLEPELSVEQLLESTRTIEDEELDQIEFNEKSEARMLIEKFVDEKPEAVAQLLRNWLNEDWD